MCISLPPYPPYRLANSLRKLLRLRVQSTTDTLHSKHFSLLLFIRRKDAGRCYVNQYDNNFLVLMLFRNHLTDSISKSIAFSVEIPQISRLLCPRERYTLGLFRNTTGLLTTGILINLSIIKGLQPAKRHGCTFVYRSPGTGWMLVCGESS